MNRMAYGSCLQEFLGVGPETEAEIADVLARYLGEKEDVILTNEEVLLHGGKREL
jgi:hypothetical protein